MKRIENKLDCGCIEVQKKDQQYTLHCNKHYPLYLQKQEMIKNAWAQMQALRERDEPPDQDKLRGMFHGNCGWCKNPIHDHFFWPQREENAWNVHLMFNGHACDPEKEKERKQLASKGIFVPGGAFEPVDIKIVILKNKE